MQLFFSPLACSLASRVLIREAHLPIDCVPVSLPRRRSADGQDFLAINPLGQVPALRFDDGRVLTENIAILQQLADLAPQAGYLPPRDTPEGQAALQWLSFTATEVHKLCLYPVFQREAPDAVKAWCRGLLPQRLAHAATRLAATPWLAGDAFGVADAYFGWALMLAQQAGVDLATQPALQRYWQALLARPAFAATLGEEQALYRQQAAAAASR
ncbi:glutathione S-transferase N-terminal domain-containing protein [Aquabacterium sp.]|uniref:glutathione S-transferase N-terminal domain-containing protein n=1 Tax=Aquabacterium sp. TaxID=1872578 RepID=UPI0037835B94